MYYKCHSFGKSEQSQYTKNELYLNKPNTPAVTVHKNSYFAQIIISFLINENTHLRVTQFHYLALLDKKCQKSFYLEGGWIFKYVYVKL